MVKCSEKFPDFDSVPGFGLPIIDTVVSEETLTFVLLVWFLFVLVAFIIVLILIRNDFRRDRVTDSEIILTRIV